MVFKRTDIIYVKEVLHITIDVVPVKQVSSAMSLGLNIDQNLRLKIILLGNIIHTIVFQHKLGRDGSEFSVRINISVILRKWTVENYQLA